MNFFTQISTLAHLLLDSQDDEDVSQLINDHDVQTPCTNSINQRKKGKTPTKKQQMRQVVNQQKKQRSKRVLTYHSWLMKTKQTLKIEHLETENAFIKWIQMLNCYPVITRCVEEVSCQSNMDVKRVMIVQGPKKSRVYLFDWLIKDLRRLWKDYLTEKAYICSDEDTKQKYQKMKIQVSELFIKTQEKLWDYLI